MDNTTHTVQPGETLSGIASQYNISPWERIAELNGITDATTLQIGQVLKLPSDTGSANDDAAASAEQTAAELAPVRSWCLPFSTTAPSTDEVARYMKALQNEQHGFYGLGKNGCWHGGVHFSRALNAENSVHCIADGEIIAWRFNQDNEKSTSANNAAHYSTNFVLVRHRLELPNENKDTQDFYSLYMHLASLSESRDNAQPTAFDPNENKGEINVPTPPIAVTAGELLGYIGQFATGEHPPANNADTLHLEVFADTSLKQFINAGRHYDTTLPANQKPWLIVGPGAQTAKARSSDTTLKHALHTGKGAAGWALVQPCAKGILPKNKILNNFNNNSYRNSNTVRNAVSRQSGVDENLLTSERAFWDGYYYDENWVRNTEATHFDASFGLSNASATHRGVLLPYGDPFWIKAPVQEEGTLHDAENIEAWHFPFSTDALEGPEAADTTILFVDDIEASLEERRDGETIHWYQVTYATEDGEHTGWVCSQGQSHVSLHSQWGWPGFEVVDNTQLTLDQYFARQMLAGNNVTEEEKSTFQAPAQAVETGPIFERIYQIISKQIEPLLPPKDIPKTMCQPKVQQGLSRLIIEQPTEWQGSEPWSCLDDYMHDEAKPGWDATKEQIDKLAWWDEVNTQAKLSLGSTVMNVHPVALVGNFYRTSHNAYLTFKTTKGIYSISKEAVELILESEGYRQHPYVPASSTTSSGITIGYGYDLGHQTKSSIENSLKDFFTHQELELLKNSAGLKGIAAESHLNNTPSLKEVSISKDDAGKLSVQSKGKYAQMVVDIYPESIYLHPHCQGALLSLIYNRGNANIRSETRKELGNIQDHLKNKEPHKIPNEIRSMKRVWENKKLGGLINRRENEAILFEEGMKK